MDANANGSERFLNSVKAMADSLCEIQRDALRSGSEAFEKAFNALQGLDTTMGPTAHDIVYVKDHIRLMHYQAAGKRRLRHPLLVVYSLINRNTILDLQVGRSLMREMLSRGIDVYMIDWGCPAWKDRCLSMDDHVNGYLDEIVDFIRHRHNVAKINLMGICMGGTLAVIYAALHPQKIKNLITTITPTHFDVQADPSHTWMKEIDVDSILEKFGNMPGGLVVSGLMLLTPVERLVAKYVRFFQNIEDMRFVENFLRVEKWMYDSPDIPGEMFRQFYKDCCQENLLMHNRMTIGGKRVDLANITMPLLNIFGSKDHLVTPAAAQPLIACVAGHDVENWCVNTGHLGIFVSSKHQTAVSHKIAQWLKTRQ